MSFNTLNRRNDYQGDGSTKVFPYGFKIYDQTQLTVIKRSLLGVEALQTLGTDYSVQGVMIPAGGSVTFTTSPAAGEAVTILGAQPLSQTTSIRNQDVYYPAILEDALDMARMVDQQQADAIGRSLKVSATTTGFTAVLAPIQTTDGMKLLRVNALRTGFELIDPVQALAASGGIATGLLKAPTDGTYGGSGGNPAKIGVGDLYEDAFDKVTTLFSKLVPPSPNSLSALTLSVPLSYQARGAGSGTLHPVVIDSQAPIITPGLTSNYASSFGDADAGTLSALVDALTAGTVLLTSGDDTGLTNLQLTVVAEFDPYAGQGFGKQDIYKAITAKIVPSALTVGVHTAQLTHSTTGSTPSLTFYVDDPATPSVTGLSMTATGSTTLKSGVPGYAAGASIQVAFTVQNAVKSHYAPVYIAQASSPQTLSAQMQPATPPAANSNYTDTAVLTVNTSQYSENVIATVIGYNSKQVPSTGVTTSANVRVDTIGSEASRFTSGTGQYPSSGYGSAYSSSTLLSANKDLQYLAGAYRYPQLVSYAAALPAGPDYSGLTPDSYANMRWATFSLGSVTNASSVTFTIQSGTNFGSSALVSGIALYVRVDGGAPTGGWVDANAAYPGTGSPSANGDAGLDVSQSTATVKRVTFGVTVRTGQVFVRIGIPSGSNKYFGGIA